MEKLAQKQAQSANKGIGQESAGRGISNGSSGLNRNKVGVNVTTSGGGYATNRNMNGSAGINMTHGQSYQQHQQIHPQQHQQQHQSNELEGKISGGLNGNGPSSRFDFMDTYGRGPVSLLNEGYLGAHYGSMHDQHSTHPLMHHAGHHQFGGGGMTTGAVGNRSIDMIDYLGDGGASINQRFGTRPTMILEEDEDLDEDDDDEVEEDESDHNIKRLRTLGVPHSSASTSLAPTASSFGSFFADMDFGGLLSSFGAGERVMPSVKGSSMFNLKTEEGANGRVSSSPGDNKK